MAFTPLIEFTTLDGSRCVVVRSDDSQEIEILPAEPREQTAEAEQAERLRNAKPPTDSAH